MTWNSDCEVSLEPELASTMLVMILPEWHPAPEVGEHSEAAGSVERSALSWPEPSQQQNQDADSASHDHQTLAAASSHSSLQVAPLAVSLKRTLPRGDQHVALPAISLKPTLLLHLPCNNRQGTNEDSPHDPSALRYDNGRHAFRRT